MHKQTEGEDDWKESLYLTTIWILHTKSIRSDWAKIWSKLK